MMPEITKAYDGSQHKDALEAILPDGWPKMQDGPIRCSPWVAAVFDSANALECEIKAREIKRAIERGAKFWRQWEICWEPGQRESVLAKAPEVE